MFFLFRGFGNILMDFFPCTPFYWQIRDKRNRLAQVLLELDQNENIVKTADEDLTTLEQNTQQTNVSASTSLYGCLWL